MPVTVNGLQISQSPQLYLERCGIREPMRAFGPRLDFTQHPLERNALVPPFPLPPERGHTVTPPPAGQLTRPWPYGRIIDDIR